MDPVFIDLTDRSGARPWPVPISFVNQVDCVHLSSLSANKLRWWWSIIHRIHRRALFRHDSLRQILSSRSRSRLIQATAANHFSITTGDSPQIIHNR